MVPVAAMKVRDLINGVFHSVLGSDKLPAKLA
jgi:hypothetical protein